MGLFPRSLSTRPNDEVSNMIMWGSCGTKEVLYVGLQEHVVTRRPGY